MAEQLNLFGGGGDHTPEKFTNSNSNENQKLELVYALFNQHLFMDAKDNIDLLQYHFQSDYATHGNKLIKEMLNSIKKYNFESLGTPMFSSILLKLGKSDAEANEILRKIEGYRNYSMEEIEPLRQNLKALATQAIISQAHSKYSNDPVAYKEYIETHSIDMSDSRQKFAKTSFDRISAAELEASRAWRYKTGVWWLDQADSEPDAKNDPYSPYYGVSAGQMLLFTSPPGTGKTMWMMERATDILQNHQNVNRHGRPVKAHFLSLGDVTKRDYVMRMGGILQNIPINTVSSDFNSTLNKLNEIIGADRFKFDLYPAGYISVHEYVEFMAKSDFDILFIDYDSNFSSSSKVGDNMYQQYGEIYDALTTLTQLGKTVFVAAQPHKNVWDADVIEENMIGESSRKIHTADIVITASRSPLNRATGIMKLAKTRRQESTDTNNMYGWFRANTGRFMYYPHEMYPLLKNEVTKGLTFADIDQRVALFNQQRSAIGTSQPPVTSRSPIQMPNAWKK